MEPIHVQRRILKEVFQLELGWLWIVSPFPFLFPFFSLFWILVVLLIHTLFFSLAEYPSSTQLQFIEEPKNVQFSNKKSGYLYCRAKATPSYSNSYNIIITWRYSNGSNVKNISNTILDLSNGTLWFPPFQNLVPSVHQGKFQCVAKLSLQDHAILSRVAAVNGSK